MKTILHLCADIGSDSRPYQLNSEYEELTSFDRTTALHSINLTDTLIKIKDKEFMKYYEKFKDAE